MRRHLPLAVAWTLATVLGLATAGLALERYQEFRSAWPWDLAYYNQWFWALTRGDGLLSVRPDGWYAVEGPPIWKMNYLAPIRLVFAPLYRAFPDPRTLLVLQCVVLWWVVPAAFMLVRAESGSDRLALAAAALVPATPLFWPLALNDFRELQLAPPFVLWAIQGYRDRDRRLAAWGIGGMLACRQEFGLVTASLALLPAREPEDIERSYRWARAVVLLGLGWFLAFLCYLRVVVSPVAPARYLEMDQSGQLGLGPTLMLSLDLLAIGLGSWALLACLAPRVAILAVPWIKGVTGGTWALGLIATTGWHHVRYTAPAAALVLAAGLVGFARLGTWLRCRPAGRWLLAAAWVAAALGLGAAGRELGRRFDRIPRPISQEEA
ncbi:MAG: DUF2079 domain-containing protein, partial [Isosphaeraceae bacterium]|nr:DUF2079 domain-containing protein [Isosphaeraceae bacterium]